ncbi:helix-turn-helix domain-containing protein [Qipengyuania sp. 1NDH17]|uniref:Helix-turn-helix domain-containing protein n=1 Tax=Qipengyuania polymorpha TaxID=2867234 RepID=A0ABS7J497_9SPHN|nr:helix-turn-helix domain-containing protein [Qipengyuania polymorpha]MBX7458874.1 helix-turn-helix domain-containing protein [Qipengyuania polymorpha]
MGDSAPAISEFNSGGLRLRVIGLAPDLAPYTLGCYRTEVAEDTLVEDWLPPEQANLRTGTADIYEACIGDDPLVDVPAAVISGATNRVTRLRISNGKFWGIGLTPAGWARLVGYPAFEMANSFRDINEVEGLEPLADLLDSLLEDGDDMVACAERITTCFRALLGSRPREESTIHAVHLSLLSEDTTAVAPLAAMAGKNPRTFERFCKRHFGFPARALLKKQRFLRSLGKYMLDPSMNWINALDTHYWDQAHFIRDFKAVMGMTPSEYAERDHPIVRAAVAVTSATAGVPHQALQGPGQVLEDETGV